MYCTRCKESFSSFQSLCPNCFGELQAGGEAGHRATDLLVPTLDNLESVGQSLEPLVMLQMPDLAGLSMDLREAVPDGAPGTALGGALLDKPIEAARKGAEQASDRLTRAASSVAASASRTARKVQAGEIDRATVQELTQEIQQALEEAARDLQSMAAATREAVTEELRREGESSVQRALDLLRARRQRIGQDLGHRLEGIRKRYATVSAHLDPGTRRSIVDRLDFLHRQATEVLGGLEKQLGGLPQPVREVVRQAADGQIPAAPLVDLGQSVEASGEGLKAGCLGVLGVFLSFIVPGLGQFVIGQWPVGIAIFFLYIVLTSAIPNVALIGWLIKGLAAWQVWAATRR